MKSMIKTVILTAAAIIALAPISAKAETPKVLQLQPQSIKPGIMKIDPSKIQPLGPLPIDPDNLKPLPGSDSSEGKPDKSGKLLEDGISNAEFTRLTQQVLKNSAFIGAVKSSRETAKTELADQGSEVDSSVDDLTVTAIADFFPVPLAITPSTAPTAIPAALPSADDVTE